MKRVEKIISEIQSKRPASPVVWEYQTCIKDKKHSFEPRYDYGAPALSKTYVYDICIKCGMVINRNKGKL